MQIAVHGGVSGLEKETSPPLAHALAGLRPSWSALDLVERAVMALEDDPALNAGYGAVLTLDGAIELDAGIADGTSGDSGGVAGVRVRHPVTLARRVLETTPHALVIAAGATALAAGMEELPRSSPEQHERWARANAEGALSPERYGAAEHVDTVGAVALDDEGGLAAASSTGGVFGKMPGRVGDAPVFGAGLYASPSVAVVGTGVGELFLRTLASFRAGRLVEEDAHPQEACAEIIRGMRPLGTASAGLLAIDARGRVGAAYRGGSWAVEDLRGPVAAERLDR